MNIHTGSAQAVYTRLHDEYGPQCWWPANSDFEVMVGAVLTQNTAWRNVEKALANLKVCNALSLQGINVMQDTLLTECLRPAGTYNVKVKRLRALCQWLNTNGGISRLRQCDTLELRTALLSIHGIGPETADAILLYALQRPVFVIDAYTRRLLQRLGWVIGNEPYEKLRGAFEAALSPDTKVFNEFHALIVTHGKQHCRTRPRCSGCCLAQICEYSRGISRLQ